MNYMEMHRKKTSSQPSKAQNGSKQTNNNNNQPAETAKIMRA